MKQSQLEKLLEAQEVELVQNKELDADKLAEICDLIDATIEVQVKIRNLKQYVDGQKEDIRKYMEKNNIGVIHTHKAKAINKVADVTSINKDLVLAVIDEFRTGERDSLEFEDVAVTKEQKQFSVRAVSVELDQ